HRPCSRRRRPHTRPHTWWKGRAWVASLRCARKRSSLVAKRVRRESPRGGHSAPTPPRLGGARVAMPANQLIQTTAPVLLHEREAELAALEAMLGAAQSGDGRLVVVEGSAGIGKRRLLAEARSLAVAAEFEVLAARGA